MPNINESAAWAALSEALAAIQKSYADMGDDRPTYERLAELADMSLTTTHTYMTSIPKRPDYTKVAALANALGVGTSVLPQLDTETVHSMGMEEMQDVINLLRQMNIEELARKDEQWRNVLNGNNTKWVERFDALKVTHGEEVRHLTDAHVDEMQRVNDSNGANIERIQQLHASELKAARESYSAQIAQMFETYKQQADHMLEAHKRQVEHIQQTAKVQYDALCAMTAAQKEADERAKTYLKRQMCFWKVISFLLVIAFILILILDITNPTRGWLQMIGEFKLFSWNGIA